MTASSAQTLCQILAAACGCLVLLFGYGAYHFGNKASEEKEDEIRKFQKENFESAQNDRQNKSDAINQKIEEAVSGITAPDPIVSPRTLNLTTSNWSKTQLLEIRNPNPSKTLYSAWVKISSESPDFEPSELDVVPEHEEDFIVGSIHNITANYEMLKIVARNENNNSCLYLVIYRLEALSSKFYKVVRKKREDNAQSDLNVSIDLKAFSNEPAAIQTQDGKTALQIEPPENLQIQSISLLMKRNEP